MIAAILRLPPAYFAAGVGAMLALDRFAPGARLALPPWCGLVPAAIALLLIGWSALLFLRAGTPIEPYRDATRLVVAGPYRWSRNPIYLGLLLLLLALWLWLASLTPGVVLPAFVVLLERRIIRHEEAALAARFGAAYTLYKERVRRWL